MRTFSLASLRSIRTLGNMDASMGHLDPQQVSDYNADLMLAKRRAMRVMCLEMDATWPTDSNTAAPATEQPISDQRRIAHVSALSILRTPFLKIAATDEPRVPSSRQTPRTRTPAPDLDFDLDLEGVSDPALSNELGNLANILHLASNTSASLEPPVASPGSTPHDPPHSSPEPAHESTPRSLASLAEFAASLASRVAQAHDRPAPVDAARHTHSPADRAGATSPRSRAPAGPAP